MLVHEAFHLISLSNFGVATRGPKVGFRGTLHYLSPEAKDGGVVTAASDMWAFGLVILDVSETIALAQHICESEIGNSTARELWIDRE